MEDEVPVSFKELLSIKKEEKEKKWDHLAVRPSTFLNFNLLKDEAEFKSQDSFVLELIRVYKSSETRITEEKCACGTSIPKGYGYYNYGSTLKCLNCGKLNKKGEN